MGGSLGDGDCGGYRAIEEGVRGFPALVRFDDFALDGRRAFSGAVLLKTVLRV